MSFNFVVSNKIRTFATKSKYMEKELFRTIIAESQEYIGRIHLVQRPLYLEEYGNYVFVGVRQAGKSYLLYQRIQQLLANGVDIEDIVYINFDDERLQGMSVTDLDFILQAYHSMYEGQPIFFFDEIQNVEGWANFARRLANQKYRVYITGSNAKMLSRDIETVLGGFVIRRKKRFDLLNRGICNPPTTTKGKHTPLLRISNHKWSIDFLTFTTT